MKAEIKENGLLIVSAENELESYAIRKWVLDNTELISNPEINKSIAICYGVNEEFGNDK